MEENEKLLTEAKQIELKPVMSSNIAGIGYNQEKQLLKVAFKNKTSFSTYLYENVEPETYKLICESPSIGKALSENIIKQKEKYKYIKI